MMPMAAILVTFLMLGGWALLSATQQWNARRDAHADAQRRPREQERRVIERRSEIGASLTHLSPTARAQGIVAASGVTGNVAVDGETVTVTVFVAVDYAFPAPGLPGDRVGILVRDAVVGVTGTEGG